MPRVFRSERLEKGLRSAALFAAIIIVYALLRTLSPIRTVFGYVEHGTLVVGTHLGNALGRLLTSEDSLATQLNACEAQLQQSAVQIAALSENARTVTELASLIGYMQETGTVGVPARITLRALPQSATVMIDKGSNDGVGEGDAVVVADGHLYGVVIEVFPGDAIIRLLHSPESHVPSALLGGNRTVGLVEGQDGTLLHMEYIPEGTDIAVGDVVVTSGLDSVLPPNLVLGLVTDVLVQDTAPFIEALIEPLYDAREWTSVLVLHVPTPL